MRTAFDLVRVRLLPAVLTAVGVVLVAGGLLTYTAPVEALPGGTDSPTPSTATVVIPTPSLSASPAPATPAASSATPSPSVTPEPTPRRAATRVIIPALDIDLPVVGQAGGADAYPWCNVAMYIQELHQPGEDGATYIYAHARTGMFLPILEASRINNGKRLLRMLVQVFTSDDQLFLYEVVEVRRHQTSLDDAIATKEPQLWLQTSEGPRGTPGKTQLVARLLSTTPADHAQANPTPHPVDCG
ncbi:MAG TPA: sortase [Candidatus Limnocylindrales bacterium]